MVCSQANDTVNEDYRAESKGMRQKQRRIWMFCKDECYIPLIPGATDNSTCGLVDNRDECEATFTCAYGEAEGPDGETICNPAGNTNLRNKGGGHGNRCYWTVLLTGQEEPHLQTVVVWVKI